LSAEKSKNEIKLTPGYTQKDGHSIIAGCGQGNLQLNKLQLEGKKPLEINEFMRGYPGFTDAHLE
jgi:methionyl-tRNA formyltransferase